MPNINRPTFDETREHPGFTVKRSRLGHQLGTRRVGLSLWELPPGQAAYPYHFHLGEEEVIIVLSGEPHLRTPEGWRQLAEGDAVYFPVGEEGAHQVLNRTEAPVRFLALSPTGAPEVVVYPDADKVGAVERPPRGIGRTYFFRAGDRVDYFEGERAPSVD